MAKSEALIDPTTGDTTVTLGDDGENWVQAHRLQQLRARGWQGTVVEYIEAWERLGRDPLDGGGGSEGDGPKGRDDSGQSRVPAGSPEGGQFASTGGGGAAKAAKALGDASAGALADVPGRAAVQAAMPGVDKATKYREAAEAELVQNPDNRAAYKVMARGLAADAVKANAGKATSEEALAKVERWSSKAYKGEAAAMANEAHAALRTPGSWAQHHYAATQGVIETHVLPRLRAEGKVDADGNVTLYRGVRDAQTATVFEASQRGEAVDLQVNKLSSWSESAAVARSFGTVVEAKVHYTKAFITHHAQGRTWADEQEWAVLSDGVEKVKVHGR